MKTFTEEELKKIIENHKHWLFGDCDGWKGMRADLAGAYLTGANLGGADLRGANLRGADLTGAYLGGADLRGADLAGVDLTGVDLTGAYLTGANLGGADLRGADLTGVDLIGAKNVPYLPMACPDKGAFIGWKKAVIKHGCDSYTPTPVIVKLRIPADAQRSSVPFRRKCRCDKAKVVGIYSISGEKITDAYAVSMYDHAFVYSVGSMVEVDNFCTDKFAECAPGIHFFMNRQEAIEYDVF